MWKPPLVVVVGTTLGVVYVGVTVAGGGLTVLVLVLSRLVMVGVKSVVGVTVPTMDVPPVDEHKAFPAASR